MSSPEKSPEVQLSDEDAKVCAAINFALASRSEGRVKDDNRKIVEYYMFAGGIPLGIRPGILGLLLQIEKNGRVAISREQCLKILDDPAELRDFDASCRPGVRQRVVDYGRVTLLLDLVLKAFFPDRIQPETPFVMLQIQAADLTDPIAVDGADLAL